MRTLVAIPVYNEERYVQRVLDRVMEFAPNVLVIDDGSTDATPSLAASYPVDIVRRFKNGGYGRSMLEAFRWATIEGYDWLITMDCDEQHEPESIPEFLAAAERNDADIISGSRYLTAQSGKVVPPENRRRINMLITEEINDRLGLSITDAFCGFKAYRVSSLAGLHLTECGYAFPMQFWAEAIAAGLRISEIPVSLIYHDPNRTFGGLLNDDNIRLAHYRSVLHCAIERNADRLPATALADLTCGCPK